MVFELAHGFVMYLRRLLTYKRRSPPFSIHWRIKESLLGKVLCEFLGSLGEFLFLLYLMARV
jgi:hypothetical protein